MERSQLGGGCSEDPTAVRSTITGQIADFIRSAGKTPENLKGTNIIRLKLSGDTFLFAFSFDEDKVSRLKGSFFAPALVVISFFAWPGL